MNKKNNKTKNRINMIRNLLVLLLMVLFIIPLKVNSLNLDLLRQTCDPLVPLDEAGTSYYCTKTKETISITTYLSLL